MKPSPLRKMLATSLVVGRNVWMPDRSRIRLMLHHTWLVTVAVCLLIAGLVGAGLYVASLPTTLRIAVGPGAGEDLKLVNAIAKHISTDKSPIKLRVIVTDGAAESAKAIDDRKVDLAVVRHDIAMPKSGLAVAILRKNVAVLLVPVAGSPAVGGAKAPATDDAKPKAATPKPAKANKTEKPEKAAKAEKTKKTTKTKKAKKGGEADDTDEADEPGGARKIEKVEDINGRRVGVIGRSIANVNVLNAILTQHDLTLDKITIVALDPDNVAASLRDNPVDVIFGAGPVTARYFADAIAASSTAKESPTILTIGAAQAIENRLPVYEATEIKAGVFGGHKPLPEEDVNTIGFSHFILARRNLSESEVGDFTKLLFGVRQSLATEFPGAAKIEKPDTDRDATVAAHPGAAAYLDNDQKTFFDRYSELLYWGLMLMSFFGSGIAWLTSYTKADVRVRRMSVLDHLVDVMTAARTAATIEELDKLRADADDILRKTVTQAEQNDLDEQALLTFSLALDQAQMAISDRRAMLMGQAMGQAMDQAIDHAVSQAPTAEVTPLRVAMP